MKPIIGIIIGLWLAAMAFGEDNSRLWKAICQVESNNNPRALGDHDGKKYCAVGIAQIHPGVVTDCNRIAGTHFTLSDRFNPEKSRRMFEIYTERYSRGKSLEVKARRWNGGPHGERNPATRKYWIKVRRSL